MSTPARRPRALPGRPGHDGWVLLPCLVHAGNASEASAGFTLVLPSPFVTQKLLNDYYRLCSVHFMSPRDRIVARFV